MLPEATKLHRAEGKFDGCRFSSSLCLSEHMWFACVWRYDNMQRTSADYIHFVLDFACCCLHRTSGPSSPVLLCLASIEVLMWWLTQYYRHMFWTEYTEAASPLWFFGFLLIADIQLAGWATLVLMTYVFLCLFTYCCVDILYVQTSMKFLAIEGLYSIHPVEFPSFTVTRLTSVGINNSKNRFRCNLELHDIFWTVCMYVRYR